MVFKRREKLSFGLRVREALAPRKGWRRSIEYLGLRMQRLPDNPSSIALGFACGVFTSFTPFFGFHFVVAAGLAWILRANVFASAIGTFIGNPVTFPFIMAACLQTGGWILGRNGDLDLSFADEGFVDVVVHLLQNLQSLVLPYFVGGLIPGLVSAVISFFLIRPLVRTFQNRRRAKLMRKARERLEEEVAAQRRGAATADPAE